MKDYFASKNIGDFKNTKLFWEFNSQNKLDENKNNLDGISGIPSKLIKHCCGKFVPILTQLFNHCIDIGKYQSNGNQPW